MNNIGKNFAQKLIEKSINDGNIDKPGICINLLYTRKSIEENVKKNEDRIALVIRLHEHYQKVIIEDDSFIDIVIIYQIIRSMYEEGITEGEALARVLGEENCLPKGYYSN